MITIWKKYPGRWIALKSGKFEKAFFWHFKSNIKHGQWFLWFNAGLFHFWKDNNNVQFGLSFGKRYLSLYFHL